VGGLVGDNGGEVTHCYSTGTPGGSSQVGGLIGKNLTGTVTGCFWDTDTSEVGDSDGGTGASTAQMKTAATYLAAGWDFNFESDNGDEDIWAIDEGVDYPKLCSQLGIGYGGGRGLEGDPYLIYTAAQMNKIGTDPNDWDKHFKLMAEIDLSAYTGEQFNIIGESDPTGSGDGPFSGSFDGNHHTITGFTYDGGSRGNVGLFGYVWYGGRIENLDVASPAVNSYSGDCTGALVGYLKG